MKCVRNSPLSVKASQKRENHAEAKSGMKYRESHQAETRGFITLSAEDARGWLTPGRGSPPRLQRGRASRRGLRVIVTSANKRRISVN
ncbi:hypothetical protein TcasGA2_TC007116 [Tribolium castaneum]|uniref:Uncharacterized protein n=1 Tax=Tribolium castaneum TaxID=7070 RepID=D2A1B2_TRICA|nr:hypothetical protein TcasGA2_TC007116 [Tribolium castaneum]